VLLFKLGAWAGMMAAAAFVRRAVPSQGDEESDDLRLVAVFNGITLESRAKAFTGGSMLAWYGGIDVDLREVELAPGARLSLHTLFGGIAIKTPPGWRVELRPGCAGAHPHGDCAFRRSLCRIEDAHQQAYSRR